MEGLKDLFFLSNWVNFEVLIFFIFRGVGFSVIGGLAFGILLGFFGIGRIASIIASLSAITSTDATTTYLIH